MATKRLPMRQIREILRLKHDQQLSHRAIARRFDNVKRTHPDRVKRTHPLVNGL